MIKIVKKTSTTNPILASMLKATVSKDLNTLSTIIEDAVKVYPVENDSEEVFTTIDGYEVTINELLTGSEEEVKSGFALLKSRLREMSKVSYPAETLEIDTKIAIAKTTLFRNVIEG